jgi:hypothetical protein
MIFPFLYSLMYVLFLTLLINNIGELLFKNPLIFKPLNLLKASKKFGI